jgi:hypothetical protein
VLWQRFLAAAQPERYTAMKLIPKLGADDIRFGTPEDELVRRFGSPTSVQSLNDVDLYPKSRRLMSYVERDFLVTPELGMISISVDIEATRSIIDLWGTPINDMSPTELADFLEKQGCESTLTNPDGWGDQTVTSHTHGIIAFFCEKTLEAIEVCDPLWRTAN